MHAIHDTGELLGARHLARSENRAQRFVVRKRAVPPTGESVEDRGSDARRLEVLHDCTCVMELVARGNEQHVRRRVREMADVAALACEPVVFLDNPVYSALPSAVPSVQARTIVATTSPNSARI